MILTAQQGKGQKIHILLDGEYRLTTNREFWLTCGLFSGMEINEAAFETFAALVEENKAKQKALRLLEIRDHCERELAGKLMRSGFSREAAQAAAARMVELGLINDETYAQSLADELFRRKGFSPARIEQELAARGVARDTAYEAARGIEGDPLARLGMLLETKYASSYQARRKTAAVWQTRSKGLATPFRIYAGRWKSAVCGRWSTKRSGRVISGWLEQSVIPYDGDSDGPCGGAEGEFSWVSALLSGEVLFW